MKAGLMGTGFFLDFDFFGNGGWVGMGSVIE
jgi:hypothetical protein